MTLFIDTTDAQKARIGIITGDDFKEISFDVGNHLSESLTDRIAAFLKKQKADLRGFKKIVVVIGPGHFSRIRSGVTTANALAFALNIPVVGIKVQDSYDWQKINKMPGEKMTLPFYGKEPNITKAKPKKLNF
jgi:tRNA A37 threonylcarbamoyladenosine modification protein TsaB